MSLSHFDFQEFVNDKVIIPHKMKNFFLTEIVTHKGQFWVEPQKVSSSDEKMSCV